MQTITLKTLKATLYINAMSSAAIGLLLAAASGPIASLMGGFNPAIAFWVGVALIPFAAGVAWVARALPSARFWVKEIMLADIAWVAATPIVLVVFSNQLSVLGQLLIAGVGLVVAGFATIEWLGTRQKMQAA
ncbi:MAG: hypothetical protein CL581_06150 [Alteromonadaceae bacterium]|nr:hypothetical protein [Alteromonadaceae bacterium]MBH84370.1 hypothetical protein [Alteromonadaceae bacterium]|tara:strand:+ start:15072 stop:15470 length:399 start_codon:yes stop_codon:yes gene_type:complete